MHITLKTLALVGSIGAMFALLPQNARAIDLNQYYCYQEYRACLAAGVDADLCRDEYYYCRFGYYPVRSAGMSAAPAIPRD